MTMRLSLAFLTTSELLLTALPSSKAFSASLRVEVYNETKIDTSFGSSNPNLESNARINEPIEMESWTEALTSPKVKEPGNSVTVRIRGHGRVQSNIGSLPPSDSDVTKQDHVNLCELALFAADIVEKWQAEFSPAELKGKAVAYLGGELLEGGVENALRDFLNAIVEEMVEDPGRLKAILSKEEINLLREDPMSFKEKERASVKDYVTAISPMLSNIEHLISTLKGMEADELYSGLKEALRSVKLIAKDMKKLNPKKKNFDVKATRCILKHILSPQEFAAISGHIPMLVKQFEDAQNAQNPHVAAPA
mmetsp:Transcript_15445/g.44679  ORF Transcript_15445/g.44679 Transcript_15445/m.44679 type:complete len:308 (+) Transcript_15445:262-1185(+)